MKKENYKIYDFYGENYPDEDWTGKIARAKFNELMKLKDERLGELKKLLLDDIVLDYSVKSLQKLNDFVCAELKEYAPNLDTSKPSFNRYAVTPYFRSLTIDCTLYLGGMVIKKDPENLKWGIYKKNIKRLAENFYPSIVNKSKQTQFASDLYIYIVQYLGGFDKNNEMFIQLYEESCEVLNLKSENIK